jgi:hypothetical protein
LSERSLTPAEKRLAQSVFGTAIEYDHVRLRNHKWWWFQPKNIVMAPRGHIHFHPKGKLFCDDFCDQHITEQGLFIHEMTHVWQHQRGIFLPLARHPFCRYSYSIKPGWRLRQYGIEQQAEIVRHYFLLKNGHDVIGAPPLSVYEHIIPFGGKE